MANARYQRGSACNRSKLGSCHYCVQPVHIQSREHWKSKSFILSFYLDFVYFLVRTCLERASSFKRGMALFLGFIHIEIQRERLRGQSLIRVVFHHGGLLLGWSLIIRVVFHQGSLTIMVVFHHGLPPWWSFTIRAVFHHGGLSSSGLSFIRGPQYYLCPLSIQPALVLHGSWTFTTCHNTTRCVHWGQVLTFLLARNVCSARASSTRVWWAWETNILSTAINSYQVVSKQIHSPSSSTNRCQCLKQIHSPPSSTNSCQCFKQIHSPSSSTNNCQLVFKTNTLSVIFHQQLLVGV